MNQPNPMFFLVNIYPTTYISYKRCLGTGKTKLTTRSEVKLYTFPAYCLKTNHL